MSYPRSLPTSVNTFRNNDSRTHDGRLNRGLGIQKSDTVKNFAGFSPPQPNHPDFSSHPAEPQRRIVVENVPLSGHSFSRQSYGRKRSPFRASHLPRQYCSRSCLDENRNPFHDEALQFVSSSSNSIHGNVEGDTTQAEHLAAFVTEHFKCPICLDVVIDATTVTCGHRFCRFCIETWLRVKRICPVCEIPVTICIRQFDIDIAIDSVQNHFSDEWKIRRKIHQIYGRRSGRQTSVISDLIQVQAKEEDSWQEHFEQATRFGMKTLRVAKYYSLKTWRRFLFAGKWTYENVLMEDMGIGVLILCWTILMFFAGEQIVNFMQYMYYAMKSYKRNEPAHLQIAAIYGNHGRQKPEFVDYNVLPDSIFAKFLNLFYHLGRTDRRV